MNEGRLREMLREAAPPGDAAAERRGLAVVKAAFAQRGAPARRSRRSRLVVALASATLLAGLVLSPAGAAVRDWIDDVFTAGVRDARPALTEVPGGGRLLVQSADGPWVVRADGGRRLLGEYGEATWSPRGLFVGATSDHTLSAVEPDGTVHWSLSSAAAPVADPRWSPSGFRIAYRAGRALHVVVADGSGDALLARGVAAVPPVWSPQGSHLLAYLDSRGDLVVAEADRGGTVGRAAAPAGTVALDWAADGSRLLLATRRALLLRRASADKLAGSLRLGPARRIGLPPGATVASAAFSPRDGTIAALLHLPARGARPARSEIVLVDAAGTPRRLLSLPGRLSDLAWAPDGSRLLIGWPDADQWLFVPVGSAGRIQAVDGISAEFSPGDRGPAAFPQIDGWCCAATAGNPGG